MKIVTIIIRTVLGLLFLYTSVSYFTFKLNLHQQANSKLPGWFNGFNLFIPTGKSVEFYVAYHL
jgi:hypothetical protein